MRRGSGAAELTAARARIAELASELAGVKVDRVAAASDARLLADWVVAVMNATGWRGYHGQLREVVERHVRTGH